MRDGLVLEEVHHGDTVMEKGSVEWRYRLWKEEEGSIFHSVLSQARGETEGCSAIGMAQRWTVDTYQVG